MDVWMEGLLGRDLLVVVVKGGFVGFTVVAVVVMGGLVGYSISLVVGMVGVVEVSDSSLDSVGSVGIGSGIASETSSIIHFCPLCPPSLTHS